MTYKYKKGWIIRDGKEQFTFAISSHKLEAYRGGLSKNIMETKDINEYIIFCKNENAKKLVLIDIPQKEFDLIIDNLKDYIEEIEIYYSPLTNNINHDKLSLCKNLSKVLIDCYQAKVFLWDVSKNTLLEKLEIVGIIKLINQERLIMVFECFSASSANCAAPPQEWVI